MLLSGCYCDVNGARGCFGPRPAEEIFAGFGELTGGVSPLSLRGVFNAVEGLALRS